VRIPNREFQRRYKHRTEKERKTKAWEEKLKIKRGSSDLGNTFVQSAVEKGTEGV
jgi:hypothetical protein